MVLMKIMVTMETMMTKTELIEVLSFLPGLTMDKLSILSVERLNEIYLDFFGED